MRAQVASLVLLALFVSAQAGFISISKDGSGSFSNVLAAKAAGKGVIITKGTTEAASGRAAAQPALVTAVAAKSVDGKVDAAKSVDVKGDAAKADVKVETAAPQAKKEEVKAAAPAPAPKAEPKKEEPKAAAAPAPAPKKEEPKKAEAQATVVAAKPAEAPKQAAAAAAMTVDKKVDVQVAAPVVKQVQAAKTVSVDIHAGKGGVSKSVIVDGGRKLQGLGKAAGAVRISVSPQQRAPAPRRVDSTPGKGFGLSKSITFAGDNSGRQAAAAAAAKTVSKEVAGPQITKFASVSADKSAAVQGRKLQGGKGGSVSVVGGDSNSVRAAAVAPSKVNGGASFSKSISKSFSLPTISISKVAEATATQTFSASKVLAAPQVTKSASFKLGRKLQGGSLNAAFSVGKDGAALGNGRAAAPAPRQTASTTGKGFSASKVITFPQITLPSFTKTVSKSGK